MRTLLAAPLNGTLRGAIIVPGSPAVLGGVPIGRVLEWFKRHAWKACVPCKGYRGFESHPVRSCQLTRSRADELTSPSVGGSTHQLVSFRRVESHPVRGSAVPAELTCIFARPRLGSQQQNASRQKHTHREVGPQSRDLPEIAPLPKLERPKGQTRSLASIPPRRGALATVMLLLRPGVSGDSGVMAG